MPRGRSLCPGPEDGPCRGDGYKPNSRDLCFACRPGPVCAGCSRPTSKAGALRCRDCVEESRNPNPGTGRQRKPQPGVCARCGTVHRPETMTLVSLENPRNGSPGEICLCPACWRVELRVRIAQAHGGLYPYGPEPDGERE